MAGPILVAVDFSDASRGALREAARLAREREGDLVLVHAVAGPLRFPAYSVGLGNRYMGLAESLAREALSEAQQLIQKWADPLREQGLRVDVEVGQGNPEDVVHEAAKRRGAQVIVTGSHGWTGLKRFVLGSIAQKILHDAGVPVLIVPAART